MQLDDKISTCISTDMQLDDKISTSEILATRQDESCTHHFQLGLTKVLKF